MNRIRKSHAPRKLPFFLIEDNESLSISALKTLTKREVMKDTVNIEDSLISLNIHMDSNLFSNIYRLAYDKSGIIQIIQQVQTDYQVRFTKNIYFLVRIS